MTHGLKAFVHVSAFVCKLDAAAVVTIVAATSAVGCGYAAVDVVKSQCSWVQMAITTPQATAP